MGVWRKWIFPIARIVVFAVIAAALVKLAFFADATEDAGPALPTGSLTDPTYVVTTGTILNEVALDGTVQADPAVTVKAAAAGKVDEVFVAAGAQVNQGDRIYDIKVETARDPIETTQPDGTIEVTQPKPVVTFQKVFAPATGVLSSLSVIPGQIVAVGDSTGQVSPPTFSVSGTIDPAQQYRLQQKPTEATVTITNGPAPFTCTGLTISSGGSSPSTPSGSTDGSGGGSETPSTGSGTTVRCAVPTDVTVFPGLAAKITIPAGSAENVLVVPTTAVEGGAGTGVVYLPGLDGGDPEQRPVTLGLSDGTNVEVKTGLAEGDEILQFTPNAESTIPDGCFDSGGGMITCDQGVVG